MSANRSVQAAQRRRAGNQESSSQPGRMPQPSINSAQMFNQQQGSSVSQKFQQMNPQHQQYQQQQQPEKKEGLSSVSKMTIPQAITLITLRLGALESKMMHGSDTHFDASQFQQQHHELSTEIIQTILSRLDSLEKTSEIPTDSSTSTILKQQIEVLKQSQIQMKTSVASIVKEFASLKTQVENLKKDLKEKTELLNNVQAMTMENNTKLLSMDLNMNINVDGTTFLDDTALIDDTEIVGTDLKELIEQELRNN